MKNKDITFKMTVKTLELHNLIGRLDLPREEKEDLFKRLGNFSGKLSEIVKNDK